MTLSPIQIAGPAPENLQQMAHVWPADDPMLVLGQKRLFNFCDNSVTMVITEVMSLGEGYIGVTLSVAQ